MCHKKSSFLGYSTDLYETLILETRRFPNIWYQKILGIIFWFESSWGIVILNSFVILLNVVYNKILPAEELFVVLGIWILYHEPCPTKNPHHMGQEATYYSSNVEKNF
ncbi:MAG: hypothetical protein C7B47_09720 [Sulfobacillus thermosulfidooxidans]|uniref:Uncharacterized protein n=1 Tax=Sulfobacillus thermosulfidooxidans TaxID=28034 RepID=A0A2T2WX98_SULTH|nr:MAG: hypothetical protein C7B47_09720 [Sulfobacillus thermosulfidooxidans]